MTGGSYGAVAPDTLHSIHCAHCLPQEKRFLIYRHRACLPPSLMDVASNIALPAP